MSNERQFIRQQNKELQQENKALRKENQSLHERLAAIEDVLYRQSQRGLGRAIPAVDDPNQATLFGADSSAEAEEDEESEPRPLDECADLSGGESMNTDKSDKSRAKKRGGPLSIPDDLERETIHLEADESISAAIAAGVPYEQLDPIITERLDYIAGRYVVKRYSRQQYRLKEGGFTAQHTAPMPPAIITHGQVEDSLLIDLAISNGKEFLPGYRLEERMRTAGITIPRSTLYRWLIRLAHFLEVISDAIAIALLKETCVHFDDTVFYSLIDADGNRKKDERHIGRFWSIATNAEAWFQYTPTREGHWVTTLFSDFAGSIVMDDYSGHKKLLTNNPNTISPVYCWAHVLRKFREADDQRGQTIINHIQQIYHLRGPPDKDPPPGISQHATPHVEIIQQEIEKYLPESTPRSKFGNALRYTNRLMYGLTAFLDNPALPLDNNTVERGMRPIALRRKNSLFAASEAGAHAAAVLATIFESCKRAQVEPRAYLTQVIAELHAGSTDYDSMRPAAYAARILQSSVA